MTAADLSSLSARIAQLESKRYQCPPSIEVDDDMRRARQHVERAKLYSASWKFVPEAYYTWPLSQRRDCLGAASIDHLCKSLLMENRKSNDALDPTNPKFVLVVVQYAAALDTKKLTTAIRALRPVAERLDDSQFDFRIAEPADNDRITGYSHNSVTPFGLREPMPIVLAQEIVALKHFWMGGGHVHLKLRLSVEDFCRALSPIVADISQPRTGLALENFDD